MPDPVLPIRNETGIANSVFGIPWSDGTEMGKCLFEGCEATGEPDVWILLPVVEKALQFLKGALIRHDQKELPFKKLLWVFFVFEPICPVAIIMPIFVNSPTTPAQGLS